MQTLGNWEPALSILALTIELFFSSSFFLPSHHVIQLIREITEAKTQKWTLPPKDMSLKIERVSRAEV